MPERLDHIAVIVDSVDRMGAFLRDVLHMKLVIERDFPDMRTHFYGYGDAQIELIEPLTEEGRTARLGDVQARLEHIAIQVDDLPATIAELTPKGVQANSEPRLIGTNLSIWTVPETSGGVQFQFMQKDAVKPETPAG
ncbi:MAG: VOC family protein [Candidatus Dormibacteraeota bacterium]|nr:VOC family protein [Candidatus Dormibacteraeota bacterium]